VLIGRTEFSANNVTPAKTIFVDLGGINNGVSTIEATKATSAIFETQTRTTKLLWTAQRLQKFTLVGEEVLADRIVLHRRSSPNSRK